MIGEACTLYEVGFVELLEEVTLSVVEVCVLTPVLLLLPFFECLGGNGPADNHGKLGLNDADSFKV